MMSKMTKYMVKGSGLQFDFINANWPSIMEAASGSPVDAIAMWQFLTQYSSALNTRMYQPWGGTFRETITSPEARDQYARLVNNAGAELALGILRELLALCNSSGGAGYYRTFFRPLIQELFPAGTLVERNGEPTKIYQIDVKGQQMIIN